MSKKKYLRQAVTAAFFAASGASSLAIALNVVNEVEPNDEINTAQRLVFTSKDPIQINGAIGITRAGTPVPDVDLYSFHAKEGDLLTVDIDGGMKPNEPDLSVRSVDTQIVIFGPDLKAVRENKNVSATAPLDEGSEDSRDALLKDIRAPSTGTYVIGVSSHPRTFGTFAPSTGSVVTSTTVTGGNAPFPNGSYKLIISGVTPVIDLVHINIEIKPGHDVDAPVNPKAQGNIPVALLSHKATDSAPAFDALKVDQTAGALTFGPTGDEKTHLRCNKEALDVNADGLLDLVCHFDNASADWQVDDREGTVKGKTADGRQFKGTGRLKVRPKNEQ
jgi:hypothetical protein